MPHNIMQWSYMQEFRLNPDLVLTKVKFFLKKLILLRVT